jgi:hypothetical protein
MKPFYIARRTERRERADRYLLWIGGIVFAAGLIVGSVWPTTPRVVFYAGVASRGAYRYDASTRDDGSKIYMAVLRFEPGASSACL